MLDLVVQRGEFLVLAGLLLLRLVARDRRLLALHLQVDLLPFGLGQASAVLQFIEPRSAGRKFLLDGRDLTGKVFQLGRKIRYLQIPFL